MENFIDLETKEDLVNDNDYEHVIVEIEKDIYNLHQVYNDVDNDLANSYKEEVVDSEMEVVIEEDCSYVDNRSDANKVDYIIDIIN